MTDFAYPWVLTGLFALVLLAVSQFAPRLRKRRQGTFVFSFADELGKTARGWKSYLEPILDVCVIVALGLLIVALARPQSIVPEEVEVEGIDIYLALDMSGSMKGIDMTLPEIKQLDRVGKKPLNRFESAVLTLRSFIKNRTYDRIGMVVFAKDAFLQFPLTLDRWSILSMVDRLRLGDIEEGGTAIGNALGRALVGLKDSDAKTKIVILITDGDRRGGNISPKQATQRAKELGVRIYPILVGKSGKILVPGGRDIFSNRISYREHEFPVNPELLQEIATETGGTYYRSTDQERLREDLHSILDEFEKTRIRDATNVDPNEQFHPWLVAALLLLVFQFVLRFTFLRKFP